MSTFIEHWAPRLLSVLRIVSAFLFLQHGTQKWLEFPVPRPTPTELWSLSGVAGLLELVGGVLLLLGIFTRPVAFVLSGLMAFAYFIGHASMGFWPVLNQGTPAILFSLIWLFISAAGPGPWSLDALGKRRENKESRAETSIPRDQRLPKAS